MGQLSYTEVSMLRNDMFHNRSTYYSKWADTAMAISPNRFNQSPETKHRGGRNDQSILKNTAGLSLRTFVSGMMNGATPQSRPWFRLTSVDPSFSQNTAERRFFSQLDKTFNTHFQISNLYNVLPSSYKDIGLFSNSAFAMLPHARFGFYFYPFAMGSYGIASNHEGRTDTFFRDFTLSVNQVVQRYGKLKPTGHIDWDNSLNGWIKALYDSARYQETITLSNMILPNASPSEKPIFSKDKLFQSYTWMEAGGAGGIPNQIPQGFQQIRDGAAKGNSSGGGVFLDVRGYDYFPIIAPRWEVAPEEDWGTDGPGELALPIVNGLQSKEQYRQEAIAKLVKPPMVGPASLKRHQASILAGGITYVDEAVKGQFRAAMTVDPKMSELLNTQAEDIQDIKQAYYEDLFLMLAGDRPVSHVTKVEIQERSAEKLQALSPVLGQLDQDQNGPIIENAFIILSEQGKIPPVPKSLQGRQIKPEYISVLAQAAKASSMTSAEKAVGFVASLAEATGNPEIVKIINAEKMARAYTTDYIGIDPEFILDEQEFEAVKKAFQQQQQQAQQREIQAQQATTARDLSQAKLGEGSALDSIAGQQA